MNRTFYVLLLTVGLLAGEPSARSQDQPSNSGIHQPEIFSFKNDIDYLTKGLIKDQGRIWTRPLHIHSNDLNWLVPTIGTVAGLMAADNDILKHVGKSGESRWNTFSNLGLATTFGTAGTFYLVGRSTNNAHAREAGLLSTQAAINTLAISTALRGISRRARPDDAHSGAFFVGGTSFPSNHAALSWSVASVVAHEYPGLATKILAYGTASGISLSRVCARKHFVSDVLLGSAVGFFVGRETYRLHHEAEIPGASFGDFTPQVEKIPNPTHLGTTYVPVDSWVYPAYDRLAALGYVPMGTQNLRPWTRLEFARLLREASVAALDENGEVALIYRDLQAEFAKDEGILSGSSNLGWDLDSVYTRVTGISGPPLTDGFHFGQTFVNDYGRPYQKGWSSVTGLTTHAEVGPFAVYIRGEYQHAPNTQVLPAKVREATAASDRLPVAPGLPFTQVNRFRLLESYVALNLSGWQLSFGKQTTWWGPSSVQDLSLSNNAEPMTMLRLTRVSPTKLPGLLELAGPVQTEAFLAQMDGYHFLRLGPSFQLTGSYEHSIDPQPYMWGYKVSVQPTRNLQFGISVTTVFSGLGRPLTFDTWLHSFSFSGNAQKVEPGDRRTGFDFSYRIPGLRKWLILYSGSMSEDEPNPIAYPRRSAWNPGLYLPQLPKLPKLDFHVEAAYTNLPNDPRRAVFYTNTHYANGYTNDGQIMGGWVGPQGQVYQSWANYWLSGQSKLQMGFRTQLVDPSYVGGGRLQDYSGSFDFVLRKQIRVRTGAQYERWKFADLSPTPRSNFAASIQLTYQPRKIGSPRQ